MSINSVSETQWKSLTDKQHAVMELLIQHKTSKEISRHLGISPHTVDQRINLARTKLDADSRAEAARRYRELKAIWVQAIYESVPLGSASPGVDNDPGSVLAQDLTRSDPDWSEPGTIDSLQVGYQALPEMFDGQWGPFLRLAAVGGIVVLLVFAILGSFAILHQVSSLLVK